MTTDAPRMSPHDDVRPLARRRLRPADALFHAAVVAAVLIALGALVWLFASILADGLSGLDRAFLTDPLSTSPERAGFNSAIRGSLVLMTITFAVALPLGFAAAIYLEKFAATSREHLEGRLAVRRSRFAERERRGELTGLARARGRLGLRIAAGWARVGPVVNRLVEVNVSNLAAVPSIVYGLLGLAVFVTFIGIEKSLLAGGLTLGLLVLPIIVIASREALRAVPRSIEDGAMALGATRWQAVSRQVVPAAFPGMLTGAILAMSRAIGEAAPLIVVGGVVFATTEPSINPLEAGDTALFAMPLQIFFWADQPQEEFQALAATGIIVLLGVLLVMNAAAIYLRNRFSRRW